MFRYLFKAPWWAILLTLNFGVATAETAQNSPKTTEVDGPHFLDEAPAAQLPTEEPALNTPPKTAPGVSEKFKSLRRELHSKSPGETLPEQMPAKPMSTQKATGLFLKMIFGMAFIILLIVLSIRWLKGLQKSPLLGKKKGNQNRIDVIDTCYLGKDQKVVVVSVAGRDLALGVSAGGIRLLKELGPTALNSPAEKLVPVDPPVTGVAPQTNRQQFSENLNDFLQRYKKPKTVGESLQDL